MKKFVSLFVAVLLTITGFSAKAVDYYLIGAFNNWTLKDASCKFSATATSGVYQLKLQKQLTTGFKINDGTWNNNAVNFGSNGSDLVLGQAYHYGTGGSSGNISISASVDNPTLILNVNAGTLLVQGTESQVAYDMYLNVCGDFNDWNPEGVKLVDGKATATVTGVTAANNRWKIKIWNGTADE